ncbi:MAG: hypothetical protein F6J96_32910 [Symploca sp. SIO1C2]|nr:hypothetical protein [Symploca sp. SIO1C2]
MILSREQQRAAEYREASSQLGDLIGCCGENNENAKAFYDITVDAVTNFGVSELYFRQAERWEAVKIMPNSASEHREVGMRYQALGLRQLERSRNFLDGLGKDIASISPGMSSPELRETVAQMQREMREQICQLEVKPADVVKIDQALNEVFETARQGNFERLVPYCQEKINQLYEARSREDRGLVENIPWWKVVAIALVIGFAFFWIIVRCIRKPNKCWNTTVSTANGVVKISELISKFC